MGAEREALRRIDGPGQAGDRRKAREGTGEGGTPFLSPEYPSVASWGLETTVAVVNGKQTILRALGNTSCQYGEGMWVFGHEVMLQG